MASSVAHDSHNIIAVGVDGEAKCQVINAVIAGVSTRVDGEAVVAVLITSVEKPGFPMLPNNIFFLKVRDNGEGSNFAPDQHSQFRLVYYDWFNYYATPQDFLVDYPCSNYYNNPAFSTMLNIAQGQIQVR